MIAYKLYVVQNILRKLVEEGCIITGSLTISEPNPDGTHHEHVFNYVTREDSPFADRKAS